VVTQPGIGTQPVARPRLSLSLATVAGSWHLPLSRRNVEIEPVGGVDNLFRLRDVSGVTQEVIGYGAIRDDVVFVRMRVVKNDGEREIVRFADLTLAPQQEGRLLVGTFQGSAIEERGPVMWERGRR